MADMDFTPALMTDPKMVLAFIFAGNATLTFRSVQSGTRYTYKVRQAEAKEGDRSTPPYFVSLLTGSDNEHDYTYLGMIAPDNYNNGVMGFRTTKATKNPTSQPVKGFQWALNILVQGRLPQGLEIWHEGRCARCNRKLTDPASLTSGFGPECIKHGLALSASMVASPAQVSTPVIVAPPVKPKPTPASIIAAVNEDAEIKKMADEMWAKNPANPINLQPEAPVEVQSVDPKAAAALAKSQGWSVEEAEVALSRRKIVNLNLKKESSKAEKAVEVSQLDDALVAKVNEMRDTRPEDYTMDGIMDEKESFKFWYNRFLNDASPVEV